MSFLLISNILLSLFSLDDANANWAWITETRPWTLLPFIIIGCTIIEVLIIKYIAKVEGTVKPLLTVLLGNCISFAVPYVYQFCTYYYTLNLSADLIFNKMRFYHIGLPYLIVMAIAEFSLVFKLLCNENTNKRVLLGTIAVSNILSSAIVYYIERSLCVGTY